MPTPQNGQTHSNNSSANCRIVCVCVSLQLLYLDELTKLIKILFSIMSEYFCFIWKIKIVLGKTLDIFSKLIGTFWVECFKRFWKAFEEI